MSGIHTTIKFMTSSALSLLGNSVAAVVLPLTLLAKTGDPLAAGTLAIACAVPQVLAGLLGGALLDRFNRRNISIISDVISALCVAALPLIDLTIGLSFGWFLLFGVLGAVGDVPGMTARDTLLPAVTKHDNIDLQRFMGIAQSVESLIVIIGPACAAMLLSFMGASSALWITAGLSCAAAVVTASMRRDVGAVAFSGSADSKQAGSSHLGTVHESASDYNHAEQLSSAHDFNTTGQPVSTTSDPTPQKQGILKATVSSLKQGLVVLFKSDGIITTSLLLSFGVVMVIGSYQGLMLPVHFTELQQPELLGYVLSVISLGTLAGSLIYSALAKRLKKRTWYVLSLLGMVVGIVLMGLLPSYPLMLLGAFLLGLLSGPISALLGFFVLDRVPEDQRGAVFGTQNSLMLVASPLAIFVTSLLVSAIGLQHTSWILIGLWLVMTLYALLTKNMRKLDE